MMKKTHKINISEFKDYYIKEAFEYFATHDFRKLKYVSDTDNEELINNTLRIRNLNLDLRGFVKYDDNYSGDVVGYIENIKQIEDDIVFDLVYMKTPRGQEYYRKRNVCFDISLSNRIMELNTSGSYVDGATLKTDYKSARIIFFYINDNKKNTLKFL